VPRQWGGVVIYAYLATALISAALAFGGAWQTQNWRYGAKETQRVTAQLEATQRARINDQARAARSQDAQNTAIARESAARRDADAARTESERLRGASADLVARSGASLEACLVAAHALGAVFDSCSTEYGSLAEKAQRHAIDASKLSEAWPVQTPTQ
jgi:hypothetical protein